MLKLAMHTDSASVSSNGNVSAVLTGHDVAVSVLRLNRAPTGWHTLQLASWQLNQCLSAARPRRQAG